MTEEELGQQVLLAAFEDELEKLAGLPREVRSGGGGSLGKMLRKRHSLGRKTAETGYNEAGFAGIELQKRIRSKMGLPQRPPPRSVEEALSRRPFGKAK